MEKFQRKIGQRKGLLPLVPRDYKRYDYGRIMREIEDALDLSYGVEQSFHETENSLQALLSADRRYPYRFRRRVVRLHMVPYTDLHFEASDDDSEGSCFIGSWGGENDKDCQIIKQPTKEEDDEDCQIIEQPAKCKKAS